VAQKIDSVSCNDAYKDAASITDIYGCQGGYFAVSGNDAFIQVQYGALGGGTQWSDEFHAPVGNGQLTAGTIGVRFRNYVAGSTAVVSAGLFYPKQPWFALSSGGNATPSSSAMVTGRVTSAGAVAVGTGYTIVRNSTGNYTVTFAAGTFAAEPNVQVTIVGPNPSSLPNLSSYLVGPPVAASFTVEIFNSSTGGLLTPIDAGFSFTAQATV
jgi:hypothetical protein